MAASAILRSVLRADYSVCPSCQGLLAFSSPSEMLFFKNLTYISDIILYLFLCHNFTQESFSISSTLKYVAGVESVCVWSVVWLS